MNIKRLFLHLPLFLALVFGSLGCSSDDGSEDAAIKDLVGLWELKQFDKGWAQIITFEPEEIIFRILDNGIIEVKNETEVDLSPLVNSGKCSFRVSHNNSITINGITFDYRIERNILYLYKDYHADGECYTLLRNK